MFPSTTVRRRAEPFTLCSLPLTLCPFFPSPEDWLFLAYRVGGKSQAKSEAEWALRWLFCLCRRLPSNGAQLSTGAELLSRPAISASFPIGPSEGCASKLPGPNFQAQVDSRASPSKKTRIRGVSKQGQPRTKKVPRYPGCVSRRNRMSFEFVGINSGTMKAETRCSGDGVGVPR